MIYALTSTKWEGEIKLEFHPNGILKSVQFPEVFDIQSLMFFSRYFPVQIDMLDMYRRTSAKIVAIESPVSFEAFWEMYNHKHGNKDNARDLWEGLKKTYNKRPISESDRRDIMSMLPRYVSRYKGDKKEFQPIPTTFLNQRYWVSEMETAPRKNEAASNAAKAIMNAWNERKNTEQ